MQSDETITILGRRNPQNPTSLSKGKIKKDVYEMNVCFSQHGCVLLLYILSQILHDLKDTNKFGESLMPLNTVRQSYFNFMQ